MKGVKRCCNSIALFALTRSLGGDCGDRGDEWTHRSGVPEVNNHRFCFSKFITEISMPKTLAQLNAQIAKLRKAAEALRAKEVAAVVAKIRALMADHGLSASDLGRTAGATKPAKPAKAAKAAKASKTPRAVKAAKVKPAMKKAARVAKPATKAAAKSAKAVKAAAKPAKKTNKPAAAGVIKYRDEAGNAWTGRGKRPQWYLNALASGKTAEQLLAS